LVTPRKGRVVEPFAAAAFDLAQKGDISGVVATRFGYHVIYLEDRKEAIHKSLEQAADEIRERIFDDVRKQKVERLLARLREKTPIERYPERLPGTSESR
jgi:parvulin-like peptidyl-prolyl isomerase